MGMTTEAGSSSHNWVTANLDPSKIEIVEPVIRYFLETHPEVYESCYTADEIIDLLREGTMQAWVYGENLNGDMDTQAIGFTTINKYGEGVFSLKIEFILGDNFFKIAGRMLSVVERTAQKLGYTFIESIVDPTFAKYLVKKQGFVAPAVYVKKTVKHERNN